jgi:hypothetical protein
MAKGKPRTSKTGATLPRPEFLPILGSRKAVNAQNDSAFEFFRKL